MVGAKFDEFAPAGPSPFLPRHDKFRQSLYVTGCQGLTIHAAIQILGNDGVNGQVVRAQRRLYVMVPH